MKNILLVAGFATMTAAVPAQATTLCEILHAMDDSIGYREQIARNDRLGCEHHPDKTASLSSWKCVSPNGEEMSLFVLASSTSPTKIDGSILMADKIDMKSVGACYPGQNPTRAFDPNGIAQVAASVYREDNYSTKAFRHFNMPGRNTIVVTPMFGEGLKVVEKMIYGYDRPFVASGRVEVAGKDIVKTSASEIAKALQERGSKIVSAPIDETQVLKHTILTAPVGLNGVTKVDIADINDHVLSVEYTAADAASYGALLTAMEAKYEAATTTTENACRVSRFTPGTHNAILATKCASSFKVVLYNLLVLNQSKDWKTYMESIMKDTPSRPVIDSDNF